MKMESMSNNIVDIMFELSNNEGLRRLLVHNDLNPFDANLPSPKQKDVINISNPEISKIYPYPFNIESQVERGSFIRVYYNSGEFNENEVIAESQLVIDIIVSKNCWLINNGSKSLIRPYEIMGRIIDMVGKRGLSKTIKLKFDGYQHLAVNTKFDAIRLYANYMSVET